MRDDGMSKRIVHNRVESLYGYEFAVRLREIPNPWGQRYIQVECTLMYNEALHRAGYAGPTSWYAIESFVDRARVGCYLQIRKDLGITS